MSWAPGGFAERVRKNHGPEASFADHPMRPRSWTGLLLAAWTAACSATREAPVDMTPRPASPITEDHVPIGKFLVDVNASIRAWTKLTMTAATETERSNARLLEKDLMRRTHARRDELIQELETGPLNNRVIAASALGFTRDVEALSPLLGALEADEPEIQSNALLGLTLLERADTPLERICQLLRSSQDGWVRSNAALCTSTLTNAGARSECVLEASRQGLADAEPGVRSQCALTLATLLDGDSLPALEDLLYDEIPMVAAAAARTIAYIGTESPPSKPAAALALVKALHEKSGTARRQIEGPLAELAGESFDDDREWYEWALRLQ